MANEAQAAARATPLDEHDLVSDGFVPADHTDPNLVNPWGISHGPTGPFWISDNGTGLTTIYNGAGELTAVAGNNTIPIATPPLDPDPATPTGVALASGQGFTVTAFGKAADAAFLFDSEDGTITGWTPGVDPAHAVLAVDNSDSGAVYKGLAIGNDGTQSLLYAANFHSGKVEVYDHDFQLVNRITDASLPKDYAPFGVQVLGDHLFVTYAKQDAAGRDDVAGKGHGFVDEFNLDGTLVQRVASHGPLDSPWGVSLAPESWGALAGDLLVGNFGDGTILAYNLSTGTFDGKLRGADGAPLHIDGLWGLIPGNGGLGGDPAKIYFTAGVDDEAHGLFGSLAVHTDALLA